MFRLNILGGVSLEGPAGPVGGRVSQRRPIAVLALLATARGPISRDKMVTYFWPDTDSAHARHLLSATLHVIRRALGRDSILSVGDDLCLNTEIVTADASEFDAALEAGDRERAVALYCGPLLDGFHVNCAREVERWLDAEQERYARRYGEAVEWLARGAERDRDGHRAVELWERLARHEPLSSRVAVRLIEALVAAGDQPEAFRRAQLHAGQVREALGVEPDPEVIALARRLAREDGGGSLLARPVPGPATAMPGVGLELAAAPDTFRPSPTSEPRLEMRIRGLRRPAVAAAALLTVFAAGSAYVALAGSRSDPSIAEGNPSANRVMVLPFENPTGDPSLGQLGLMATDWIADGLASTGLLEVIGSPTFERPGGERASGEVISPVSAASSAAAPEPSRSSTPRSDAGTVVGGAIYPDDAGFLLRTYITRIDALGAAPELVPGLRAITGSWDDPMVAVEEARHMVMGALAVLLDQRMVGLSAQTRQPPSYPAYEAYVKGLEAESFPDKAGYFLTAARLDPTFTTPLFQAAWVLGQYGDARTADSVWQVLQARESTLGTADQHHLASRRAATVEDRLSLLARAAEISPDKRLELATVAFRSGFYRLAVDSWLSLPNQWAGTQWASIRAALHFLGEHDRELSVVLRWREEEPQRDIWFLEMEGSAHAAQGHVEEALAAAEDIRLRVSDTEIGESLVAQIASELLWHGQPDVGRQLFEEIGKRLQSRREVVGASADALVEALIQTGRAEEAFALRAAEGRPSLERPDSVLPTRWRRQLIASLGHWGTVAAFAGNQAEVEWALRELEAIEGTGSPYRNRAQIAGALGDCNQAVQLLDVARTAGHQWIHRRMGFLPCIDHPRFREVTMPKG